MGIRSIGGGTTALSRAPIAVGVGIAKDPKKSIPATARGGRDALIGIPSAVVSMLTDPLGTLKKTGEDYSRRYGDINQPGGISKMADRISKEGAAPEILDAISIATATGAGAGRALTKPAAAGKLGPKARSPRRSLARRSASRAPRPSSRRSPGTSSSPSPRPAVTTKTSREEPGQGRRGEGKRRPSRRAPGGRGAGGRDPRPSACRCSDGRAGEGPRSRADEARAACRGRQGARGGRSGRCRRRNVRASRSRCSLGIPANPQLARVALAKRRDQIVAARKEEGVTVPKTLSKTNDEVAILDGLIADADKAFTPRLREVVKGEQARERRLASSDPGLDLMQAQLRRYAPQAAYLGIKREDGETDGTYLRRVVQAARAEGLERPGYFPSQKRPRAGYADRARGGAKAIAAPQRYTGELFRTGREVNTTRRSTSRASPATSSASTTGTSSPRPSTKARSSGARTRPSSRS